MVRRRRDENHLSCAPEKRRIHEICSRINLETSKVWPVDQQLRPILPAKSRLAPCSVRDNRCMCTIVCGLTVWRLVLNVPKGLTIFMDLSVCCSFLWTLKASLHMWRYSSQSRFAESNKLDWLDETLRGVGNLDNVNQFHIKIWQIWVCGVFGLYSTVVADFFVLGDKQFQSSSTSQFNFDGGRRGCTTATAAAPPSSRGRQR